MGSLHIIFQADGYCLCNTMPTQNAFFVSEILLKRATITLDRHPPKKQKTQ